MTVTHNIRHDEEGGRFVATVEGHEAYLDYRLVDDRTVEFRNTYVPNELRGQGLAGKVVVRGLEWARERGVRVIPTCSYVRGFLDKHPEYASLTTA